MTSFRKHLSIPGLLILVRSVFSNISDHRKNNVKISLPDALMSGLAMFLLKYSSLLKFEIVVLKIIEMEMLTIIINYWRRQLCILIKKR